MAVDADRHDVGQIGGTEGANGADDRRPPRAGILLDPAVAAGGIEVVAAARQREQPAVEGDQAGLDLGRPEIEPEDRLRAGGHAVPPVERVGVAASSATTASAVAISVTSVRTTPARSAPRIGRTLFSPEATPIATGSRPSRRASSAMTRSRRAGQTNRPSMSNGATRTSPTASAASRSCSVVSPSAATLQAGPPIPNRATSTRSQRSTIARTPGVRDERPLRGGVVDETGRHQPACLATECVGDATVRLALGAGRPVAAAQRHDRDRDGRGGLLEGRGGRGHRRPVADTDDRARPERAAEDLGGQPADHPAGEILRTGDGRGEMDGVEAEGPAQDVAGRALDGRAVDDPDLDDPFRPRALEQARHLRPRDAELLGDRVLRLAELVIEAARPDELLQVAHRAPCTFVLDRCAFTVRRSSGLGEIVSSKPLRAGAGTSRRSRFVRSRPTKSQDLSGSRRSDPRLGRAPAGGSVPPAIREELSSPGKRSVDRDARR